MLTLSIMQMNFRSRHLVVAALAMGLVARGAMASEKSLISVPAESIVRIDSLSGKTIESSVRLLDRDLERDGTVVGLEGWSVQVGIGYSPLPCLRLGAFVGAADLDLGPMEGDYGMLWGVNSTIALLEYVIEESPVFGRMKAIRFMADIEYLHAEPGLEEDDLSVDSFMIAPHVVYAVNLRGPERWHPYGLLGVALRGGAVIASLDVDVDDQSYEAANDLGILLGADLQFDNEITLRLTSHIFSEDDMTVSAGLGYYF